MCTSPRLSAPSQSPAIRQSPCDVPSGPPPPPNCHALNLAGKLSKRPIPAHLSRDIFRGRVPVTEWIPTHAGSAVLPQPTFVYVWFTPTPTLVGPQDGPVLTVSAAGFAAVDVRPSYVAATFNVTSLGVAPGVMTTAGQRLTVAFAVKSTGIRCNARAKPTSHACHPAMERNVREPGRAPADW